MRGMQNIIFKFCLQGSLYQLRKEKYKYFNLSRQRSVHKYNFLNITATCQIINKVISEFWKLPIILNVVDKFCLVFHQDVSYSMGEYLYLIGLVVEHQYIMLETRVQFWSRYNFLSIVSSPMVSQFEAYCFELMLQYAATQHCEEFE